VSKNFDFNTLGIASVLKLHRIAVPPYQREYAWEQENVDQLYDDLALAKLEGRDYFLGTIVTIPREGENVLEIIDGQQRLTTTAILLAAIRDHLKGDGRTRYQGLARLAGDPQLMADGPRCHGRASGTRLTGG